MITEWRWLVERETTMAPRGDRYGEVVYNTYVHDKPPRLQYRTGEDDIVQSGKSSKLTMKYSEWQDVPTVVVELTDE